MFSSLVTLVLAVSSIVTALPSTESSSAIDAGLRLIKTSEADPGTWVTEEQKIAEYVAQNRYFIDITDIKVRWLEPRKYL
jgi:leucyl aminopeptidase